MTVRIVNAAAVASRFLQEITATAADVGISLPERQLITAGGAVYDCEMVVVSMLTSRTGLIGAENMPSNLGEGCDTNWSNTLEAAIVVCAQARMTGHGGRVLPTPAMIEQDATTVSLLGDLLVEAATRMGNEGYGAVSASLEYGSPQGGLIAAVLTVGVNSWISEDFD